MAETRVHSLVVKATTETTQDQTVDGGAQTLTHRVIATSATLTTANQEITITDN